ncbi:hypothetical protein JHU04_001557 [Brenneria sp. 4F2]|nr:hypothetical protein [Brenneria bubanii]
MNITSIVIIYNSALKDSDTLKSLLRCKLENIKLELCVWNNGPHLLEENDVADFLFLCSRKNIKVNIYQDTRNISLSKIYNFFIKKEFDYISILDQDSILPTNFLEKISINSNFDIITPKIMVKKDGEYVQYYPHLNNRPNIVIPEGKVDSKIISAMSGLTLSKDATNKIMSFKGYIFEERLAFYGIDNDIFRTINMMENHKLSLCCLNEIHHSLSTLDLEEAKSEFRMIEIFYFKYFIRMEYQKKSITSTIFITFRDFMRGKMSFSRMKNLIIFSFKKSHPRSKHEIPKNKIPTHYL